MYAYKLIKPVIVVNELITDSSFNSRLSNLKSIHPNEQPMYNLIVYFWLLTSYVYVRVCTTYMMYFYVPKLPNKQQNRTYANTDKAGWCLRQTKPGTQ